MWRNPQQDKSHRHVTDCIQARCRLYTNSYLVRLIGVPHRVLRDYPLNPISLYERWNIFKLGYERYVFCGFLRH